MSRVGDVVGAESLARSYDRGAAALQDQVRSLEQRLQNSRWKGSAAERTREALRDHIQRCTHASHEMAQIAAELRRYAYRVRERENELRRLESRIRSWAAANQAGPDHWPNASLVLRFPPTLDPTWDDLARRLRLSGAVF